MKQLLLIRHGKSDWKDSHITSDFDRPLNHRGHKNAPAMAEKILKKGLVPQHIVSSPAIRAWSTAKHFAEVWNFKTGDLQAESAIYEANTTALLKIVNGFSNNIDSIAMFGHNPGFTDFANYLADADLYNIPTAGVVVLRFDTDDWAEIGHHTGTMLLFDFPKNTDEPH